MNFKKELQEVIDKCIFDQESMKDNENYILCEYICKCIDAYETAKSKIEKLKINQ